VPVAQPIDQGPADAETGGYFAHRQEPLVRTELRRRSTRCEATVARHLRTVAFRAMMRARAGGRRARLGLWQPGLRQREVSGVQHDNAFLPPFVRSATIQ